jgi:hypothetical protein
MKTEVQPPQPSPVEVLIPEARTHQRQRYARTGVTLTVVVLVIASLIAAAVALWGAGAGGKTQASPPPVAAVAGAGGRVYFRPVLCEVPLYNPAAPTATSLSPSSCTAGSAMTAHNLDVQPAKGAIGFVDGAVPPDAALVGVPSTKPSADHASATVLLPQIGPQLHGAVRYLLGPAEMSSASIASARVIRTSYGDWEVAFSTTASGSALWDKVTQENFHQELAIELNGVVYSAPLIQPQSASFYSFDGKGWVSGQLTKANALRLASALRSVRR